MAEEPKAPKPKPKKLKTEGPNHTRGLIGIGLFVLGIVWMIYDIMNPKPDKKKKGGR